MADPKKPDIEVLGTDSECDVCEQPTRAGTKIVYVRSCCGPMGCRREVCESCVRTAYEMLKVG